MAGKTVGDKNLRVLIADASGFVRLILADIFSTIDGVEVVGAAQTGNEALRFIKAHKPDVLLMDPDLPQNNRWFTLERIANECPLPVLILNSKKRDLSASEQDHLKKLGVYGFINKPANILKPQLRTIKDELVQKLYESRHIKNSGLKALPGEERLLRPILPIPETKAIMHLNPVKLVVLGASTGGTKHIETMIQWLQPDFRGCILVAIHLPETFVKTFVNRLNSISGLKISLAKSGTLVEAGKILVAPGGRDMYLEEAEGKNGMAKIMLTKQSDSFYDSPSIDRLMTSAAHFFTSDTIGIILTGMGNDGTAGMAAISAAGGVTIVQDQHKSGVFGMVKSALNSGVAHHVLTLPQMVSYIEQETLPGYSRPGKNKISGS